jgi:hypothetical protein
MLPGAVAVRPAVLLQLIHSQQGRPQVSDRRRGQVKDPGDAAH